MRFTTLRRQHLKPPKGVSGAAIEPCRRSPSCRTVMADIYGRKTLAAGALAAVGASLCCAGPLVLVGLGISGAWIGTLTALAPVRPVFVVATLACLGLAFRALYLRPQACALGKACAAPRVLSRQRLIFWIVGLAALGLLAVPDVAALFLF
jgi:mercuric ion transport protein